MIPTSLSADSPSPESGMASTALPSKTCGASVPLTSPMRPLKLTLCQRLPAKPEASRAGVPDTSCSPPSAAAISLRVVPAWNPASVSTGPAAKPDASGWKPSRTESAVIPGFQLSSLTASVGGIRVSESRVFSPPTGAGTVTVMMAARRRLARRRLSIDRTPGSRHPGSRRRAVRAPRRRGAASACRRRGRSRGRAPRGTRRGRRHRRARRPS